MDEQEFFEKFAELAIRIGVNLQPDQELVVFADVEHAPLVRATMEAGWRAGASDVQCGYREPYDRLFLGRYAADDRLDRSPFANLALWDHLAEGQRALRHRDVRCDAGSLCRHRPRPPGTNRARGGDEEAR